MRKLAVLIAILVLVPVLAGFLTPKFTVIAGGERMSFETVPEASVLESRLDRWVDRGVITPAEEADLLDALREKGSVPFTAEKGGVISYFVKMFDMCLSCKYNYVEQHGGWVIYEEAHGSRFPLLCHLGLFEPAIQ